MNVFININIVVNEIISVIVFSNSFSIELNEIIN